MKKIVLLLILVFPFVINAQSTSQQNLPFNREKELEYTHKLGELVLKKNVKPFQAKVNVIVNNKKIVVDNYYFVTTKGTFLLSIFDHTITVLATENSLIKISSRFLSCDMNGEEVKNYLMVKEAYDELAK